MNKKVKTEFNSLLNFFNRNYNAVYKNTDMWHKRKLLKYAPTMFSKWFYSTLIDETIMSPSNIINTYWEGLDSHSVIGVSLIPPNTLKGLDEENFKINIYSSQSHPVIKDLRILAGFINPTMNLNYDDSLENGQKIIKKLSQPDIFYLEYLIQLSLEIGITKRIPSIHSNNIVVSDSCNFFKLSQKEALSCVINKTISMTSKYLSDFLQCPITESTIKWFLSETITIDDIFKEIYTLMGLDINEVWDIFENDEYEQADSLLISSTFYLGIVLDKKFLTYFGTYLRMICPFYFTRLDFKSEINGICTTMVVDGDVSCDLFSPCSFFSLTPIGNDFFDITKEENDELLTPAKVRLHHILNVINNETILNMYNDKLFDCCAGNENIYTLKIKYISDRRFWKTIEITGDFSLNDLSEELSIIFGYESSRDYYFIINGCHYVSSNKNLNSLKTYGHNFDKLGLCKGDKFIFQPMGDKFLSFEIEIVDCHKPRTGIIYPRLVRQSRYMTDEEKFENY